MLGVANLVVTRDHHFHSFSDRIIKIPKVLLRYLFEDSHSAKNVN